MSPNASKANSMDLDEDEWDLQYDLLRADQIVVADDTNAYQIFGDALFTAPQEDLLEGIWYSCVLFVGVYLYLEQISTPNMVRLASAA